MNAPHPAVSAALTVLVMRAVREKQNSLMWKLIYSPGFSPEMFTLRHNTPPWVADCQVSWKLSLSDMDLIIPSFSSLYVL